MTRNVSEIQRRLIEFGYLALGEDDGRFGVKSLDAFNRFRASKGEPPIGPREFTLSEVSAELFPGEAKPLPPKRASPLTGWLTGLALKAALSQLKGPAIVTALAGYKTYIVGGLMVAVGVATVLGLQIPGVPVGDGLKLAMDGFAFMFLRAGVAKIDG